jgi:formate hydrogenlyase transcriptional activator
LEELSVPEYPHHVVAFEFQGRSLYAAWDQMAYVYRLEGYETAWQVTYARRVEYTDLPLGNYVFQVQAVDPELHYSAPVSVRLTVEPDPHRDGLTRTLRQGGPAGQFVGTSAALRQVQRQLAQVAPTELTVLILGETGTGKGLAARRVHELSRRRDRAFIQVNCGAIPEGLVESELFGHEKGAFTSAVSRQLGKVELAQGGTLFLDEIGDLPLEAQGKLLRLLEEGTFERVGGSETLVADVRVVAATNRTLEAMVDDSRLRADLYYRLQGFEVHLPPLRERQDDIELLALYFAECMAVHLHQPVPELSPAVLARLRSYDWPGNVRELEHAIQRAVIVGDGRLLRPENLALGLAREDPDREAPVRTLADQERHYIVQVLEQVGWVLSGDRGAAARLGLPVSTLRSRMKKLGITRPSA